MILTREYRLTLGTSPAVGRNAWAGRPASDGLGSFVGLRVTVEGEVDATSGYVCSIGRLDELLRDRAIPVLQDRGSPTGGDSMRPADLLAAMAGAMASHYPAGTQPVELELRLSPYLRFTLVHGAEPMVQMTEQFEFSASHRLYCPDLSSEENQQIFGKCANPNGHGHNYVLDVTVGGDVCEKTGSLVELGPFERTVIERIIQPFDHKNLNQDCPEFADLNPTVENIARVIWTRLKGRLAPAQLVSVRLWETPKTCAEYRGGE